MLLRFPAWKVALIVATLLTGFVLSLPNYVPDRYLGWLPTNSMRLGLDLRGGASILLEVDQESLRANRLREISRDVRESLLAQPSVFTARREVVGEEVVVQLRDPGQTEEALTRLRRLGDPPLGQIGAPRTLDVVDRGGGLLAVSLTAASLERLREDALANSIEGVRRRVDQTGTVEPNIQRQGENRIVVEVPGLDDPAPLIDVITRAGVLTFNLVDVEADPATYEPGESRGGRIALPSDETGGAPVVVFEDPIITGSDLQNASQGFDERGRPNIQFLLRPAGAQKFGRATGEKVGRPFAIVLDNRVVSAPVIQSPILSGSGQITGDFSIEEAGNLAIILRAGALPAKLTVAERRVVGAGLGADSIRAGVSAAIVGIILTTLFMVLAYGLLGVFAVTALYLNVLMIVGVLSGLQATLTLPGIAGIILTVGMAVDANVLVFERIRDEKKAGRSPVTAVETGYEQAMSTIIDANLTTLLAGLVLYFFGTGPVRGFAVTLSIGILTSMFTAVIVARWIMAIWLRTARPKHIPI
jgi:protein-export membrane protein SecD